VANMLHPRFLSWVLRYYYIYTPWARQQHILVYGV